MKMKNAVVLFLLRHGRREILLALKHKESEIASLKWNGYGGKMEPGERPAQAAVRELIEETDGIVVLQPDQLSYGGVIRFHNSDGLADFRVHIFLADDLFTALPPSTEVMISPTWLSVGELDHLDMMPADKIFLPLILDRKMVIEGSAWFESGFRGVKEFAYREISQLEAEELLSEIEGEH